MAPRALQALIARLTPLTTLAVAAALRLAWIVAWASDVLDAASWFQFFMFTTVAYLISRGVAKASRVLEQ